MARVDEKFIVNLKGKQYITYEGLLDLATQEGLTSIETNLIQIPTKDNDYLAIVQATAYTKDKKFMGIGDCDNKSANSMITPHKIRMAECVPTRAKILTIEGWKHYSELKIGELVLAYDINQDINKWTELKDISVYKDIPTVSMETKSFYAECTENHKWATQCVVDRKLKELNNMGITDRVITSAYSEGGDSNLSSFEATILGWLITDGSIREMEVNGKKYIRFTIYQSKPKYVEELKELTKEIGSYSVERGKVRDFGDYISNCLDAYKFTINAEYGRNLLKKANLKTYDDLIPLITNLKGTARKHMLDAMLKADGTKKRKGQGNWEFGTKKEDGKIMEAFEILCTLQGITLGKPRTSTVGEVPVRILRSYRRTGYKYMDIEEIGNQDVWCPTTKYGTWIMNLDGNITITGNTRAKARALRDFTNIGMTAFEELGGEEEKQNKVDEDKQTLKDNSYATDPQIKLIDKLIIEKKKDVKAVIGYMEKEYGKKDFKALTQSQAKFIIETLNK